MHNSNKAFLNFNEAYKICLKIYLFYKKYLLYSKIQLFPVLTYQMLFKGEQMFKQRFLSKINNYLTLYFHC